MCEVVLLTHELQHSVITNNLFHMTIMKLELNKFNEIIFFPVEKC